jgi:hypothetical protein
VDNGEIIRTLTLPQITEREFRESMSSLLHLFHGVNSFGNPPTLVLSEEVAGNKV